MGRLEAEITIWAVNDFIRRYTGSGKSHGALFGTNLVVTTGHIPDLSFPLACGKKIHGSCCSRKSARKSLLSRTFQRDFLSS